jgi:hypothetical protein
LRSARRARAPSTFYRKRADGSGDVERLTQSKETEYVSSWSGDGKYLVYFTAGERGDLWILPLSGDQETKGVPGDDASTKPKRRFRRTADGLPTSQTSRAGRGLRAAVRGAGKWQVSEAAGGFPAGRVTAAQLFFRDAEGVMSVPITVAGASIEVGRATPRPQRHVSRRPWQEFSGLDDGARLRRHRDGSHFVMYPPDAKTAGEGRARDVRPQLVHRTAASAGRAELAQAEVLPAPPDHRDPQHIGSEKVRHLQRERRQHHEVQDAEADLSDDQRRDERVPERERCQQ